MLKRLFTEHPASVGETYGRHLVHATGFGLRMIAGGLACLLHGVLPFLLVRNGSRAIERLHEDMVTSRARRVAAVSRGGEPRAPERRG